MNSFVKPLVLLSLALVGGGCSLGSALLDNKSSVPQAANIAVGNPLAMPPDLQLPPPGQGADVNQVAQLGQVSAQDSAIVQAPVKTGGLTRLGATQDDVFSRNGIAKTKADGTAKTPDELGAELKAVLLAKKKQANPNYGSIRNIGSIFSDQ